MNWERAKTVLIIFFLIINICFAGILVYMRYSDETLSEDTVKTTVSLLSQHGIIIKNANIIPKQKMKNQNYSLTTLMFSDNKLLKKWLGDGYKLSEEDSSAYCFTYQNANKRLVLNKTGIDFINDKKTVLHTKKSDKDIEDFLSARLKEFNFNKKEYYFSKVWFENGLYHGIISPLADNTKILGIELEISADKEEIINIKGNYFTSNSKEEFDSKGLLDITAILAKMVYLPEKPISEMTGISYAGYVSDIYIENKEVTAVPVYVIEFANGVIYYYDARTGEMLD
ncbi:MAG: hypothetical protein IKW59_04925 [Clostridia bacterium]|nr:hypothetical protein [Clostridia bacterium]